MSFESKTDTLMTSPVWSLKMAVGVLVSTFHRMHVESPDEVMICKPPTLVRSEFASDNNVICKQTTHAASKQDTHLLILDETAARQVALVLSKLAIGLLLTAALLAGRQLVHGAQVVQTTAGNEVAARRVRAGHHPRGPQRDRVDLVGRERVPDLSRADR
jgi:hypothetical protein